MNFHTITSEKLACHNDFVTKLSPGFAFSVEAIFSSMLIASPVFAFSFARARPGSLHQSSLDSVNFFVVLSAGGSQTKPISAVKRIGEDWCARKELNL
jgi:hypothetical protein